MDTYVKADYIIYKNLIWCVRGKEFNSPSHTVNDYVTYCGLLEYKVQSNGYIFIRAYLNANDRGTYNQVCLSPNAEVMISVSSNRRG